MRFRHRQQGLSAISILIIVLVAVFFGTCAVKLGPEYIDSFTVKRAVEATVEQAREQGMDTNAIKSSLQKMLDVNRTEAISVKDVVITREKGTIIVDASYEKRVPLMFNIDVVLKFDSLRYEI